MNFVNKAVCGLVLTGMLIGCGGNKHSRHKIVDANTILNDKSLSNKEKAAKLTESAELLISPAGLTYAKLIIDKAIALDPANRKIQLYKNIIDVQVPFKGLLSRVKPLAASTTTASKVHQSYVDGVPESANKSYLMDGPQDIHTEKQLQAQLDAIHDNLDDLRSFLKNNKDEEFDLKLIDWKESASMSDLYDDSCIQVTNNDQELPEVKIDEYCSAATVDTKLNRADMETLIQAVGAQQLLLIGATAYDVTGSLNTAEAGHGKPSSDKEIYGMLAKSSEFGLARGNKLKGIMTFGAELVSSAQMILNMQKEVCPTGETGNINNRPGYLVNSGLCLRETDKVTSNTSLGTALVIADLVLNRQLVDVQVAKNKLKIALPGQPQTGYVAKAVLSAPLDNPIADIKTLLPEFNECDKVSNIADATAGGLLPNGDAGLVLKTGNSCQ